MIVKIQKQQKYPKSILKTIETLGPEEFGVFNREFSLFTTSCFCFSIAFVNKYYADNTIRLSISAYQKEISKHFLDLRAARIIGKKFVDGKKFREKIIKLHTHFGNKVLKLYKEIDTAKTITPSLVKNLSLNMGKFFAHNMPIQTSVDYVAKINTKSYYLLLKQRKKFERSLIGQIEQYIDKLCKKLAKNKEPLSDLLKFLTAEEMVNFIESNKLPKDLTTRRKLWVLIRWPKPILLTGKSAFNLLDRLEQRERELNEELVKKDVLIGIPTSPGIIKEPVQVIKDFKELKNLKDGHILVAPTISPKYYNFIIKKARGIIMDEGGLLSHAAILSREFKIPCIVGTKAATRKLKTGQIVELDAISGVIKIIKNPSS